MDKWATKYQGRVNFICVGCQGPELASAMGQRMRLNNCVNCFIATQKDMPRWGQLGCSGFIILGSGDQRIITPKTAAYLEVQEQAFRQVESILDSELTGKRCSVRPGDHVKVTGLEKAPDLNGEIGVVLAAADDEEMGRCVVQILSTKRDLRIKVKNLQVLNEEEIEAVMSQMAPSQQGG